MKLLKPGIALAMVGAGLAAVPTLAAQAAPQGPGDGSSMVAKMQASADGNTVVQRERSTGQVGFIRSADGGDLLPSNNRAPAAKADAYLDQYAQAFGAPRKQLQRQDVTKTDHGTVVDYTQTYRGVPVFGTMLRAHVNTDGELTSVNGEAVPDLDLSVTPRFDADQAAERAVAAVKADPPGDDGTSNTSGIKAVEPELMVYRTGLVKGEEGTDELVWRVEVTNEKNVRDVLFMDAMTNKPVNRYSMIHDALDRAIYEADEDRELTLVWEEGAEFPGDLNDDQQNLVRSAGETYWFFMNAFNRDSYDGKGHRMNTINNDPAIQCPNANWNGQTTNYCNGVTSDDVVAHEWGHAYTEFTHGLIYQWQAGALNEAYSDIWGETIDLINGREDEDEGNLKATREVGQCSTNSPSLPLLTINSPSSIAKDCLTGGASFGEQLDAEGLTGDVVAPTTDGSEGSATEGCTAYNEDVSDKVVIVDRGTCTFEEKAQVATEAGASALIIGNNDDAPFGMSGNAPDLVPTVSIGLSDREAIRDAVGAGETVNVTMKDAGGERGDSFRWLVGEKSPAFGGAIRDMWNPNCYGDPGKVTDAEYKCGTDDNGGVHGNSGVPNHGYALLVDGGTFNGVTVEGIGLDKAANIYYTAMNEYQTPVSDFTDHANSLEASCAQLTGRKLWALSTDEDDQQALHEKITANDCAQVAAMARAVELRTDPAQCEFEALLPDAAGSPCGKGFESRTVWSEDFEDELADWTQEAEIPEGSKTMDWEASLDAPQHESMVAYAPDPASYGDCIPDSDDYSSAASLISPEQTVPADGEHPVLSFDHYVATELGYDGGLVRMSVNGGDFEAIPTDAYTVNGPNTTMESAETNTSPLAGQDGFSGTDGGELRGSWGTSRVDLAAAGVEPGDTVQFAFVMGRDGCNGFDGWYVDDVELTVCDLAPEPVASKTKVNAKPKKLANKKKAAKVVVKVTAKGTTPTGTVRINLKKKVLAKGKLNKSGKVAFKVKGKQLKKGKNKLVATYLGNKEVKASKAKVIIKRKK